MPLTCAKLIEADRLRSGIRVSASFQNFPLTAGRYVTDGEGNGPRELTGGNVLRMSNTHYRGAWWRCRDHDGFAINTHGDAQHSWLFVSKAALLCCRPQLAVGQWVKWVDRSGWVT